MPRYTRNTVILAKVETTYGTDATPTGAEAMLTSKPQLTPLQAQNVARDVVRGTLGGSEQLVGSRFSQCTFDVELVGSGTAGTPPAWGALMAACGWAETATATTRVDYTLVSAGFQSISIYWYDDGVLHKLAGARGECAIKMTGGTIPVLSFTFKGLYSTPTAAANATPTLTAFKVPAVVNEANTDDLKFGGTHSGTGAPAIVGGTAYPSMGLEFALNNTVEHVPLVGGESIDLTQRDASCSFQLELTAAQEVTFMTAVAAATLTSVGLVHGTVAGFKSLLWLPNVQRISPTKSDMSGKRMVNFEGRAVPSSGNDEARLVLF
ncbi:MAG TPA: phage tail tube protein [Ramlibacter sp.]|jgi:hypothetical protein